VTRVAVSQSNYIPWKGYFDLIHDVDLFVFYDDVQFTKNDWRNRNRVKGPRGSQWLTIPVGTDLGRLVCEVELPDPRWQRRHLRTLEHLYAKAPYFDRYRDFVEDVYLRRQWRSLSELNQFLIRTIATDMLGIAVQFRESCEFATCGKKQERLLSLLAAVGAETYVSGPAARAYLTPEAFAAAGIRLVWKDYAGYPEYGQFHPPFDHAVTILDLLFHVGPEAPGYVWGWRDPAGGVRAGA
jgi:hypothetical protein